MQTYEPIETIVVDNASTDRTHELLSALDPEAVLLRNHGYRGFVEWHNRGMRRGRGQFFLNHESRRVLD